MNRKFSYLILSVILCSCAANLTKEQSTLLKTAYKEQNCFVLDNLMSKVQFDRNNPDLLLYKATLDNVFNQPKTSNISINTLLTNYPKYFNDSIISDLFSMRQANHCLLEDYKQAYEDGNIIISNYKNVCDSSEIESYKNMNQLFQNLFDAPKMQIKKGADSKIPLKRDKAGLFNVPVSFGTDTVEFVFDTGANFSTITESLAAKYGVKILGEKFKLGSSTSIKVEAKIGIADIKLDRIEIKNVVFCVVPDSTLSFAKGAYAIRGIIGFPVMNALQEFIIKDDKYLIILNKPEKPNKSEVRNFALDGFTPIIKVVYKNDILPFHFDTGANKTDLYSLFFNKYNNEIIGHTKKETHTFGGAGGTVETESYLLDSLYLTVGNSNCQIDSLRVTKKDIMGKEVKYVYGNFGQDYIKQFSEMNVNFSSMSISFANRKK